MAPNLIYLTLAAFALLPVQAFYAAGPKVLGLDFHKVRREVDSSSPHLRRRAGSGTVTESLLHADILYIANVTVGTPPQNLSLQLDTGSSDLWVPDVQSDLCHVLGCDMWGSFDAQESTTFQSQDQSPTFEVSYGDQSEYAGEYGTDTISIAGVTMENVIFGVVQQAKGIQGTTSFSSNGLIGISFDAGEAGAELGLLPTPYPGFVSQLKNNGRIKTRSYSLWLNDVNAPSGSILFGGVDTSKYTPPLLGLPMVGTNSSDYSTIDRLAVEFTGISLSDSQGTKPIGNSFVLPALLDSGTSATLLQPDLAQAVLNSAGAVTDPSFPSPLVSCNLQNAAASYIFAFGGDSGPKINVSLSQLITPAQGLKFKDGSDACEFGIQASTDGNIILGDPFLRSAYVVYDLDNNQIAMAQTNFNGGSPNIQEITGNSIPDVSSVMPSLALPASLSQPTGAASTEVGGPSATPTVGDNGIQTLSETPGKPSFTAAAGAGGGKKGAGSTVAASRELLVVVVGVVSLCVVLGGSTFFMFA